MISITERYTIADYVAVSGDGAEDFDLESQATVDDALLPESGPDDHDGDEWPTKSIQKYSEDQPRDDHGRWGSGSGSGSGTPGTKLPKGTPPSLKYEHPPVPLGKSKVGGKAGGRSASGKTNTIVGDHAEHLLATKMDFHNEHPGSRQGKLDVRYDHSNFVFEVKSRTTDGKEYKIGMKKTEMAQKEKAAAKQGLRMGMMLPIIDIHAKTMSVYWRAGLGNFRLKPGSTGSQGSKSWHYAGKIKLGVMKSIDLDGVIVKYSEDQPRDDHGRFGSGGSGSGNSPEQEHLIKTPLSTSAPGGQLKGGINQSFLAELADGTKVIIKPEGGRGAVASTTKILKTFPDQVQREVAARDLAEAVGDRDLVPPTAEIQVPDDHPTVPIAGRASAQEFVNGEPSMYGASQRADPDSAMRAAMLDFAMGNFDRHRGNFLIEPDGKLHLIDHGFTFPEPHDGYNITRLDMYEHIPRPSKDDPPPAPSLAQVPETHQARWAEKWENAKDALRARGISAAAIERVDRRIDFMIEPGRKWSDLKNPSYVRDKTNKIRDFTNYLYGEDAKPPK